MDRDAQLENASRLPHIDLMSAGATRVDTDVEGIASGRQVRLPVEGMTCSACATRLEKALDRLPGVAEANVNFALERADVSVTDDSIGAAELADTVRKAGFSVADKQVTLSVDGMTCSACATRLEKALAGAPGVLTASVNFALERADVRVVSGAADAESLGRAVRAAGFTPRHLDEADDDAAEAADNRAEAALKRDFLTLLVSAALTAPLLAQMFAMWSGAGFHLSPLVELSLATPVQFIIGARFYRAAWNALRAGSSNMDVLVAMGTSAAYFFSIWLMFSLGAGAAGQLYFEASTVIITLVLFGKYLESRQARHDGRDPPADGSKARICPGRP